MWFVIIFWGRFHTQLVEFVLPSKCPDVRSETIFLHFFFWHSLLTLHTVDKKKSVSIFFTYNSNAKWQRCNVTLMYFINHTTFSSRLGCKLSNRLCHCIHVECFLSTSWYILESVFPRLWSGKVTSGNIKKYKTRQKVSLRMGLK